MPTKGGRRRWARRTGVTTPYISNRETHPRRELRAPGIYSFGLAQRLQPRDRGGSGWFGPYSFEYMGSAKFILSDPITSSVERISRSGKIMMLAANVGRDGVERRVWFVGTADTLGAKIADFRVWLQQPALDIIEPYFHALFMSDFREVARRLINTVAWWSLTDDVFWTLDEDVAIALASTAKQLAR